MLPFAPHIMNHEIKLPSLQIQVIQGEYHMTTMDENVHWMKLANQSLILSSKP